MGELETTYTNWYELNPDWSIIKVHCDFIIIGVFYTLSFVIILILAYLILLDWFIKIGYMQSWSRGTDSSYKTLDADKLTVVKYKYFYERFVSFIG